MTRVFILLISFGLISLSISAKDLKKVKNTYQAKLDLQEKKSIKLSGKDYRLITSKKIKSKFGEVSRGELLGSNGAKGNFTLTNVGGFLKGIIWLEGKLFEITSAPLKILPNAKAIGPRDIIIEEIDPDKYAEDDTFYRQSSSGVEDDRLLLNDESSGTVIDLLMVYTNSYRESLGSVDAAVSNITLAVDLANQGFSQSGSNIVLNLVGVEEVNYQESGSNHTDLDRLISTRDNYLDEVHSLRDSLGADIVSLVLNNGSACGSAYVLTDLSDSSNPAYGMNVVHKSCMGGSYSLAHEIGHLLGSGHDHQNSGDSLYQYSYGHRFYGTSGTEWRTIMAYSPGRRVNHFSNPLVNYDGVQTGNNLSHNQKTFIDSAPYVANYRPSSTTNNPTIAYALSTQSVNYGNLLVGEEQQVSIVISNTGSEDIEFSFIEADHGDLSILNSNNCLGILPANTNCEFIISYYPSTVGNFSGKVTIIPSGNAESKTISVSAVVEEELTSLYLSPSSLEFSRVKQDSSASSNYNIVNNGNQDVSVMNYRFSNNQYFSSTNNCLYKVIPPGGNCLESVTFNPSVIGDFSDQLNVGYGDSKSVSLSLQGQAVKSGGKKTDGGDTGGGGTGGKGNGKKK